MMRHSDGFWNTIHLTQLDLIWCFVLWPFHNVFSFHRDPLQLRFYDCLEGPYVFAGGKNSGPREAKGKRRAKVQWCATGLIPVLTRPDRTGVWAITPTDHPPIQPTQFWLHGSHWKFLGCNILIQPVVGAWCLKMWQQIAKEHMVL